MTYAAMSQRIHAHQNQMSRAGIRRPARTCALSFNNSMWTFDVMFLYYCKCRAQLGFESSSASGALYACAQYPYENTLAAITWRCRSYMDRGLAARALKPGGSL